MKDKSLNVWKEIINIIIDYWRGTEFRLGESGEMDYEMYYELALI